MRELSGKAAFVTGGASGIGLAMSRTFARTGMKVMIADIEEAALADAVKSLKGIGPDVRGVRCCRAHRMAPIADPTAGWRQQGSPTHSSHPAYLHPRG